MSAPVVVGVDGSERSLVAVDLAIREAVARDRPLRVVHAFVWPYVEAPLRPPRPGPRDLADRILAEAVDRAVMGAPGLAVSRALVMGAPSRVLLAESTEAALVVLGYRGTGGFAELLAGSVATQVSGHAECPVLVARGTPRPGAEILLGLDGSPANDHVVGFAFEEAALRGVPLLALHTWTHPTPADADDLRPFVDDLAKAEAEEARVLAEALAGWTERYPEVVVHRRLARARSRPALLDATGRAQLVVVGSRGRGGFAGLLLGSVGQALLHHAACPVAIVPPGAQPMR